jgi:hypothetical protein
MFLACTMGRHVECTASDAEGHSGPEGHAPARTKLDVHPSAAKREQCHQAMMGGPNVRA